MVSAGQDLQVLGPVILSVPVSVMNDLPGMKRPADHPFRHEAMFGTVAVAIR